ncbi:hypothetical protein GYMLUDRAFT_243234 [Collybiopsis luxurians FD-317 M1]|uniref:Uncharacterized protein n=1 Tax=Collybiopsis luxurians FD-317 M1 TaxID=944289 RepID=A0A0D0C020_9AGAR|nr:hypothetical protein GYMLUDRAFT_243234 [Collybiopsis luxurians FD-317 M1]
MPGFIYIQAANMFPHNTSLVTYLHLIDGFMYSCNPTVFTSVAPSRKISKASTLPQPDIPMFWDNTHAQMLIHFIVSPSGNLKSDFDTFSSFSFGTWVEILDRLYHGNIGVIADNPAKITSATKLEVLIVLCLLHSFDELGTVQDVQQALKVKCKYTAHLHKPLIRPAHCYTSIMKAEDLARKFDIELLVCNALKKGIQILKSASIATSLETGNS